MQEDLVSIITPLYNGERFVAQTIESVLAQTYPHWEMIIINDGSKDNSEAIVQKYTEQDARIQLVSQSNAGSAAARNNGILISTPVRGGVLVSTGSLRLGKRVEDSRWPL